MKFCVYGIAKNEEQFVERFMKSTKGADLIIVADTGSSDNTIQKLKNLGATVHSIKVDPWRFDTARNKVLELIPEDIDWCLSLDLDEVLVEGWREKFDKSIHPGITRLRYKYTWSWKAPGIPDVQFLSEKTHIRHGYKWHHPCHEVLQYIGDKREIFGFSEMEIEHHPDNSKPRSSYLPLLELSVLEDPYDDRNMYYLGREYFFNGQYDKSIEILKRHLGLSRATWQPERSASMRYIAACYERKWDNQNRLFWLMHAVAECPDMRESWMDLAKCYYDLQDHFGCYYAAKRAINIKERALSYITNALAWSERPYDLAGVSAFYIGLKKESLELCQKAYEINPSDERLKNNVEMVRKFT